MQETSTSKSGRIPHAVFSVAHVPDREKFALWRDSAACIFDVEAPDAVRESGFYAEIDAHMFGPLLLLRTRTCGQRWHRTPEIVGRDGMDHYLVQVYEHGGMEIRTRHATADCPENGVVIYDLAQEVATETSDFSNLSLFIPRDMLSNQLKTESNLHGRIMQASEPMVALLRDHISSLKRLADDMTAAQAHEVAPATVGLVAACLNAAAPDDPQQREGVAMARFTLVRRFIEEHLAEPELSAARIARQVGVSRTKLYELFAPHGGIATYIRERRLRRALLMLSDATSRARPVYDIAVACGYASDTAFARAFRARYGLSPNDVRHGAGLPPPPDGRPETPDRRYERWIHYLTV